MVAFARKKFFRVGEACSNQFIFNLGCSSIHNRSGRLIDMLMQAVVPVRDTLAQSCIEVACPREGVPMRTFQPKAF